jgi:uncharacterized FlgJ-related protein
VTFSFKIKAASTIVTNGAILLKTANVERVKYFIAVNIDPLKISSVKDLKAISGMLPFSKSSHIALLMSLLTYKNVTMDATMLLAKSTYNPLSPGNKIKMYLRQSQWTAWSKTLKFVMATPFHGTGTKTAASALSPPSKISNLWKFDVVIL